MRIEDISNLKRVLRGRFSPEARILEVGCGTGVNLRLLKTWGFKNVLGIDIAPDMVSFCQREGLKAQGVEDFFKNNENGFDLVLFAHVLEHIPYEKLQGVMEGYFSRLRPDGYMIIVGPILYDGFFVDVDHVRPYYPEGLIKLFSPSDKSRQYGSSYSLALIDIHYRRQPLLPAHLKCSLISNSWNRFLFRFLSAFYYYLKLLSFGLFAKTTGFCALFRVTRG